MLILAIDTAANLCSISIWEDDKKCGGIEKEISRGHAAVLAPICHQLLSDYKLTLNDIDQTLVNTGPGSFTGIRVGLAFAKGLASSTQIPLKGISAFDAAYWGEATQSANTLIVLDARRKDFYCQLILKDEKQQPASMTLEEIDAVTTRYDPTLVGNGVLALKIQTPPPALRGADSLVAAYHQGVTEIDATPYYLREPDVMLKAC